MRRYRHILLAFLFLLALLAIHTPTTQSVSLPALLFVVDGQSNAGSQGKGSDLTSDWRDVGSEILLYAPQYTAVKTYVSVPHTSSKRKWHDRYGVELGLYEAIRAQYPGRVIAFVRRSKGGGDMTDWCSNTKCAGKEYIKQRLLTNTAVAKLLAQPGITGVEIAGVIWLEVNGDGRSMSLATNYQARLEQLIRQIRADTGNPQLPVLFIAPHGRQNNPTFAVLDAAVRDIAANVPFTALIETTDLPTWEDSPAHFNSTGMLILGQRFGAAWLTLQEP